MWVSYTLLVFFLYYPNPVPSPPSLSKDLRLLYFHLSEMLEMRLKLEENKF